MPKLVCCGVSSLYTQLCRSVLDECFIDFADSCAFYGAGTYVPGCAIPELLDLNKRGVPVFEVGTIIDIDTCVQVNIKIREYLGYILSNLLYTTRYAFDVFSRDSYLHYGAKIADTFPLLPLYHNPVLDMSSCDDLARFDGVTYKDRIIRGDNVGLFLLAVGYSTKPFSVILQSQGYRADGARYSAMARLLTRFGVELTDGHLNEEPITIDPLSADVKNLVEHERQAVQGWIAGIRAVLERQQALCGGSAVSSVLQSAGVESEEPVQIVNKPFECKLGSVFDPTTHYRPEYYGDNAGLLYMMPDGTKHLYKGPARLWAGFSKIVKILYQICRPTTYLSVGCGAGNDVRAFLDAGVTKSFGVDISESAVMYGKSKLHLDDNLIVGDFRETSVFEKLLSLTPDDGFDFVASYDFLEHIWYKDLETLVMSMLRLLKPGGVFFNVVCTPYINEAEFIVEPGTIFTQQNSSMLVSGHVTVMHYAHWIKQLFAWNDREVNGGFNLEFAYDIHSAFCIKMAEDVGLCEVRSWSPKNIIVFRKGI